MDIERMHDVIEKLSETVKCEFDKGIENVDTCEMKEAIDILKDLSEAMYYRTLTVAMDESGTEETMDMFDRYGEDRRFYDRYRYKNGRFAPKGRGTYHKGYSEPPYYRMTPEMMKEHSPEYWRDKDRDKGIMYYTEPIHEESRYDKARRMYTETRDKHRENTAEDKQHKMKSLEAYMKELSEDITELIGDMTQEERSLMKNKVQVLAQKL